MRSQELAYEDVWPASVAVCLSHRPLRPFISARMAEQESHSGAVVGLVGSSALRSSQKAIVARRWSRAWRHHPPVQT